MNERYFVVRESDGAKLFEVHHPKHKIANGTIEKAIVEWEDMEKRGGVSFGKFTVRPKTNEKAC